MSVKPPVVPVAAATLVLLRDRPGGDHVFPGGKVETHDNPDDAASWCAKLDADAAAERLGLSVPETLAHLVGAIRETFEEVGILLAYDADGQPVQVGAARFAEHRAACQTSNAAFWTMVRAEKLTLATDRLVYFAHWITPEEQPLRFDTRFFAAPMLPGQDAVADGREITEVRWLAPDEALAAATSGEISLRNPTARNIELFRGGTSAEDAVRRVVGRDIPTIRPRVIFENGQRRVLMPGDPGYF